MSDKLGQDQLHLSPSQVLAEAVARTPGEKLSYVMAIVKLR